MYVSSSDLSLNSTLIYPLSYSTSPFKYLLDIPKLIRFIKNKLKFSYTHTLECVPYTQLSSSYQ